MSLWISARDSRARCAPRDKGAHDAPDLHATAALALLSRLAMAARRDLLVARRRDLVVIGVGIVIGVRLIGRPVGRPAAEHIGIGMVEGVSAELLDRGLCEHRRCTRRYQKRDGKRR